MQTAGQYRLQQALSTCDVGDVWSGVDHRGRIVTIAVLNERASVDDRWRGAFAAAAATLAQAGADQLPIVDADHDGPRPWVACARERGGDAAQIFEALGRQLRPVPAVAVTDPNRYAEMPTAQMAPVPPAAAAAPNATPTAPRGAAQGQSPWALPPTATPTATPAVTPAPPHVAPPAAPPFYEPPAAPPVDDPAAAPPFDDPAAAPPVDEPPAAPPVDDPERTMAVPVQRPPDSYRLVWNRPGSTRPAAPPDLAQPTTRPDQAQPTTRPDRAQPTTRPEPARPAAQPTSGQPVSPYPGLSDSYPSSPAFGPPTSGPPTSGSPGPGWPVSGSPGPGSPVSGLPVSGLPVSGLPVSGSGDYRPYPNRFSSPPPTKRRRTGLLLVLVAVVGLLVGAGGALAVTSQDGGEAPRPVATTSPPTDQQLLLASAPSAPGVEPPLGGGWPSGWPVFAAAESTRPMNKLEGVGFDFRVPPDWDCTRAEQGTAAVHYRCGRGGTALTSGGDLVVRACQPPCTEDRRTALRQREEAWGLRWTRSGPFTTWAETTQIDGRRAYGLVYVAFWRSTPEGQVDRELVLRMTAPLATSDELKKVANAIRDRTFTL